MKLRVLIADDEPLARERLRRLVARDAELLLATECADGLSAVRALDEQPVDLAFLDVQMPGLDGFSVLERTARPPRAALFVTAFDEHALRAFEVAAVDYLLKPFSEPRFAQALARAKERARSEREDQRLLMLLESMRRRERLVIRDGGRVSFLPLEELDWARAAGNYVELHAGKEVHLLRGTLSGLEEQLDARFLRVHRSTLVNVARVRELRPLAGGDHELRLRDGTKLLLSRTHKDALERLRSAEP